MVVDLCRMDLLYTCFVWEEVDRKIDRSVGEP